MEKLNFFMPLQFEKAVDKKTGKTNYKFHGVASDDSEDLDKEILEPGGFDYNDLLKYGTVNYNHLTKSTPRAVVGEPTSARVEGNKFIIDGILYGDSQLARDIIETAQLLENSSSSRRMGMSLEGVPILRDPINNKRIKKARITGVAITLSPKNKNTVFQLVKGEYDSLYQNYEYELEKGNENGSDIQWLIDVEEKGIRVRMDKELNIKIEKSLSTENNSQVIKESLEKKPKNLFEIQKALVIVNEGYKLGLVSDKIIDKVKNNFKEVLV